MLCSSWWLRACLQLTTDRIQPSTPAETRHLMVPLIIRLTPRYDMIIGYKKLSTVKNNDVSYARVRVTAVTVRAISPPTTVRFLLHSSESSPCS